MNRVDTGAARHPRYQRQPQAPSPYTGNINHRYYNNYNYQSGSAAQRRAERRAYRQGLRLQAAINSSNCRDFRPSRRDWYFADSWQSRQCQHLWKPVLCVPRCGRWRFQTGLAIGCIIIFVSLDGLCSQSVVDSQGYAEVNVTGPGRVFAEDPQRQVQSIQEVTTDIEETVIQEGDPGPPDDQPFERPILPPGTGGGFDN